MNLHLQLDFLRLHILLENYTKENGEKVDELTGKLNKKFASVSVNRSVGGRGQGVKRIEFTNNPMDPQQLYNMEEGITPNPAGGAPLSVVPPEKPIKYMQIKPSAVRSIQYKWYPEITINEHESSLADRISFEDRLMKAMQLFGQQSVNMDYAKEQFAVKNKLKSDLFFVKNPITPAPTAPGTPGQTDINSVQETPVTKMMRTAPSSPMVQTGQ